jgi:hypothetical protein
MSYKEPLATTTDFGIVKVGAGLSVTAGTISATVGLPNYGFFTGTTPQTNPVANAVNFVTVNNTGPANGISISGGNSLVVVNAGVYTKLFTMNVNKTSGGASTITIWLRYNGVDLVGSTQDLILTGALDTIFVSGNFTLNMAAGSNIQMCWSSADTTMRLLELPARVGPVRPTGDSIKVTLTRIS